MNFEFNSPEGPLVSEVLDSSPLSATNGAASDDFSIIEGVFDALECADEVDQLYLYGPTPGLSTGLHSLDPHFKVKKGHWTILTGIPGSGKSTILDTMLVNLSELHGWKHFVISPENQPVARHVAAITGIRARQTFHRDYLSQEAYYSSLQFTQDHFRFVNPPDENFTVNYILDLAKYVEQENFPFDCLVIDPWNEMEHKRPAAFSETEYISWALSKFRRYCRDHNKHLFLVAHPVKMKKIETKNQLLEESARPKYPVATPYDISGSAHFYNKCDNALSIWRDKYAHDNQATVHVQKIRFRECGTLGQVELRWDWQTGRYEDI